MDVIRPNCRIQLSPSDIEFIISALAGDRGDSAVVEELTTDVESLDIMLDDRRVLDAILRLPRCIRISYRLYFYVLVRHALRSAGLDDRVVADYVAELLAHYAMTGNMKLRLASGQLTMDYVVDAVEELRRSDGKSQYFIQAFIGNYLLFFTGLFPGRIAHRTKYRAAPDMAYYEAVGCSNYHTASQHQLAQTYDLDTVYQTLSDSFRLIRLALNDMSRRLMFLESPG